MGKHPRNGLPEEPGSGSAIKTGSRLFRRFLNAILIAIAGSKSGSDCETKTQIDFEIKTADRFSRENRDPIFRSKSIIVFSGTIFDRDQDRDCRFKIGIRLRNENRRSILRSKPRIDFHMKIGIRFHVPSVRVVQKPVFNRGPVLRSKSLIDFHMKIGIRYSGQNRLSFFPERFLIAIMIAFAFSKPGTDCEKIITREPAAMWR